MKKQTAGRDSLGDFAPKFAELNDDVLFGEIWSREDKLSLKMRSIVTVTALISKGDILGFLCKKGGLNSSEIGKIDVNDRYAYAAIARTKLRSVLNNVKCEKIKGVKTIVEEVR